jgi:hypothetical protein
MAIPTTRQQLIDYCLRQLGAPVLEINVDEDQIEDRIDEALQKYRDWHMDGQRRTYIPLQYTNTVATNKYFTLTDDVLQVVRVLPITNSYSATNMFSMKYQMYLNDFYALYKAESLQYYVQMQQYLQEVDQLLNGVQTIQYQRHGNKLYVEANLTDHISVGQYVMAEAYVSLEDTPEMYNDMWLKKYATALIKRQWGTNLSKFDGMQLPGGVTINASKISDEANEEIKALDESLINSYALPPDFIVG